MNRKVLKLHVSFLIVVCMLKFGVGVEFIPSNLRNEYGDALEAIFSMGIRLESLLRTNATHMDNFLISPLSITLLLGQMMVGANQKFKDNLYQLVSLSKHSDQLHPTDGIGNYTRLHLQLSALVHDLRRTAYNKRHFDLSSANALFVNHNIRLQPRFVHETELLYGTQIFAMDFQKPMQVMQTISKWASDHTNGLIPHFLPSVPGPQTAGIFANAIYFNGKWEQPFSSELNTEDKFKTGPDSTVPATFMTGFLEQVPYAESKRLNCKMIVFPYERREVGMYIVLPNPGHPLEYNIKAFASQKKISDFLEMLGDLRDRDVVVKLPKLSLTSSVSMLDPLQKYATYKRIMEARAAKNQAKNGAHIRSHRKAELPQVVWDLKDLEEKLTRFENFNLQRGQMDEIHLTEASLNNDFIVSDILQHISFSINEMGTEAAAISAGIVDYSGGSKTFLANKPFVFFIRHEATAATLFWGTISKPS